MAGTSAASGRGGGRSGGPSAPTPSAGRPPSKRARSSPAAGLPSDPEDPFGALLDFTEDDLEELDSLASQALSQAPAAPRDPAPSESDPRTPTAHGPLLAGG